MQFFISVEVMDDFFMCFVVVDIFNSVFLVN